MAIIDSVKLPDNSTYDLTDNYSGYAKKVAGATTDDLASLTATGDLADSGKKLSDLVLKSDVKDVLNSTSTTDPLSAKQGKVLADNLAANENVYGAKNLLPVDATTQTVNTVLFTIDENKVITINGTVATTFVFVLSYDVKIKAGDYTLSIGTEGTGCALEIYSISPAYDMFTDSEAIINIPNDLDSVSFRLWVGDGTYNDVKIYPMLRDARILDDTFVPYVPTNRELMSYKANGKVGAKNLNSLPYYESAKSENGITFTSDDNGIVTVSGTASALVALYMHSDTIPTNKLVLPKGNYILSGCPVGGSQDTYCLRANFGGTLYYDIGSGVNFTLAADTQIEIAIIIKSGTALPVGGITFKPMIRIAEDTDETYQPFAMTNRQLTERKYEVIGAMKSSIDMNTLLTGVHVIGENITNSPASTVYGVCFCMNAGNTGTQLLLSYQGDMYYRVKTDGNWASWKTITAT